MNSASQAIEAIRREWGRRLLILGHHYQRSAVIAHADERGDSLELARKAATHREAERIVFCGVRFMAESADILAADGQVVYMPEPAAGCPMADMADARQLEAARAFLEAAGGDAWLPVVYVNSSAALKAACGDWGGAACTSSNASRVFRWVLQQGRRVLFVPDEHLGRNTAHDLGLTPDQVAVYDPHEPGGGLDRGHLARVRVLVWKGFCLVHQVFSLQQVHEARARFPGARVIVHPEAPREVVAAADAHGSTSRIIDYVRAAPEGCTVVVGTELNLVQRLAEEQAPRVTVKALRPSVCANMARTNEQNLLAVLRAWPASAEVHVPREIAAGARKALERMLEL